MKTIEQINESIKLDKYLSGNKYLELCYRNFMNARSKYPYIHLPGEPFHVYTLNVNFIKALIKEKYFNIELWSKVFDFLINSKTFNDSHYFVKKYTDIKFLQAYKQNLKAIEMSDEMKNALIYLFNKYWFCLVGIDKIFNIALFMPARAEATTMNKHGHYYYTFPMSITSMNIITMNLLKFEQLLRIHYKGISFIKQEDIDYNFLEKAVKGIYE